MHQPGQWWLGLGPVAMLWLAACMFRSGPVETDIASRSRDSLVTTLPAMAGAISVTAAGRDVLIEGPEFEPGQGDRATLAILRTDGVRRVVPRFHQVQTAKPFEFGAIRTGNQFTLTGSVPSPAARDRLLSVARSVAAGATIVDKMVYAIGAPDGFEAIATRGLTEAAKLDGGAFALVDAAYAIAGTATSSEAFEAAIAATRQLPDGAVLTKVDVLPAEARPPSLTVTSDGAAATMTGSAPSIEARAALAVAAGASLPGRTVVNHVRITRGRTNGDFTAWANYGLSELGRLSKGSVAISDGAYSIEGETGTSEAFEAAIAGTRQLPTGLELARADILAPEIKPYGWEANSDGRSVTLSGFAPNPDIRTTIAASATRLFPDRTIVNQMQIARGAPDGDFGGATTAVLTELAKLSDGKVVITDAHMRISGHGPVGSNAVVSASMPAPFSVAAVDIKEPAISQVSSAILQEPARLPEPTKSQEWATSQESAKLPFAFTLDRGDGRTTLGGEVPDDKARSDLIAAARAVFINDAVVDELKIGKATPENLVGALAAIFPSLARLRSGTLTLNDAGLTAHGLVDDKNTADEIKTSLADATPSGLKISDVTIGVQPAEPALQGKPCEMGADGFLLKGRILFDRSSSKISEESQPLLDNLVEVARRCRDAKIEVSGYTDYIGYDDFNIDLSKRRAQAVVDVITRAGIDASRLTSAGHGEAKPVASNDTPEGRTQNRRIEFLVK